MDQLGETVTIIIGSANLAFTIVCIFIIDTLGRKTILVFSLTGMYLSFSTLHYINYCPSWRTDCIKHSLGGSFETCCEFLIGGFVACYALGPGLIPFLLMAEMYKSDSKPVAVSLVVAFNFVQSFLIAWIYPYLEILGTDIFLMFSIIQLFSPCYHFFARDQR